jgi:hypothetical protein
VTIGGGALFGMVGLTLAAPLTSAAVHISNALRPRSADGVEHRADGRAAGNIVPAPSGWGERPVSSTESGSGDGPLGGPHKQSDPVDAPGQPAEELVVIAAFENRRAAESLLRSLGREFRHMAHSGDAAALVITGNADGSLKLTQSRVVTASGVGAAVVGVSAAMMAGLVGTMSALKGAKAVSHAAHKRASHVGSDSHRARAILAEVGPRGAIALLRCKAPAIRDAAVGQAAERASSSWDGSRTEFLAALDSSEKHDWLRAALDEPSGAPG